MKTNLSTKKIALAGVFTALAVVGSFISFPVAGSKCAPVQHMVNILAAVTLGPFWGIGIAFIASLLRNLLALGSLMAFPGSMVGALCCGLVYHFSHKLSLTCAAEALGTGILGGIAAYPVAVLSDGPYTCRYLCLRCTFPDLYRSRKHPCVPPDHGAGKRRRHERALFCSLNRKQGICRYRPLKDR